MNRGWMIKKYGGMWWFRLWPFRLALNEGGNYAVLNVYFGGQYIIFVYVSIRLWKWYTVSYLKFTKPI